MSFLSTLKTVLSNPKLGAASDVGAIGNLAGWIDTGSYALNALLSGSIYGGLPSNKVTAFAGPSGVGKTYYALQALSGFLKLNPENEGVIFDSEAAITTDMLIDHEVPLARVAVIGMDTVERFRTAAAKILEGYRNQNEKKGFNEPRLMIILDSLGNLSTEKEVGDVTSGTDKRDMTKPQLVRGAFRVLTLKCGELNVPMILTNHTYASIGTNYPSQTMSGGGGLNYAASTILMLSKSKDKDEGTVVGAVIRVKTEKARFTREQQVVETLLSFTKGLDRYYGLLEIAEEGKIFVKVSTRYQLPDGRKAFESQLKRTPEKYYTPEVLKAIDEYCQKRFPYGEDEMPAQGDEEVDTDVADT